MMGQHITYVNSTFAAPFTNLYDLHGISIG